MRVDELRRLAIFEGLSDERLEQLLAVGQHHRDRAGAAAVHRG